MFDFWYQPNMLTRLPRGIPGAKGAAAPCGGSSICEHKKIRSQCHPCMSVFVSPDVQKILDSNTLVRYDVIDYPAYDPTLVHQPILCYDN